MDVKKFENGRRSVMNAAGGRPKLQSKLWSLFQSANPEDDIPLTRPISRMCPLKLK